LLDALPVILILWSGCVFNPHVQGGTPGEAEELVTPTRAHDLITNLEVIYNDEHWSASERLLAYRDLFPPDDHPELPVVQFCSIGDRGVEMWDLDAEVRFHEKMFEAQQRGEIVSITFNVRHRPAAPIDDPDIGQEDWQEIFCYDTYIRIERGAGRPALESVGRRFRLLCSYADGRWYINRWEELQLL
jgi:hypothetical protein